MAHRTYRQYQKKQRSRVLAVQAALGVSIVALTAGIGYASLCIVRGQAVLPGLSQSLAAWLPLAQPTDAAGTSAPGTQPAGAVGTPVPEAQPADAAGTPVPEAQPADAAGTPVPEAQPADAAGVPVSETRPDVGAGAGADAADAAPTAPAEPAEPAQPSPAYAAESSAVWNTQERLAGSPSLVNDTRFLSVPENGRLSDDYFRDALFIGDSVTQGFGWYPEYKDWMRVCAYKGIGPQNVLQNMVGQRPDGTTSIEMWDDIKTQQGVANIYILFGANALLSQSDEAFLKYYSDLLDRLREQFPGVPIYVQSLTPTTLAYGQKRPALARDHLSSINEAVAKMAIGKGMYYVDLWEVLADEDGYLRADLSGDGLHLHDGSKYRPWLDYLATHTVYSAHNAQFALAEGGPYA